PSPARYAYRPGSASQSAAESVSQVIGPQSRSASCTRPSSATTASASPGPARRRPAAGTVPASGGRTSGGTSRSSDLAGMTTVSLAPASSQPSDRYSGIVAGNSADSGYPCAAISSSRAVISIRPISPPRYSGATVTLDT